MKKFFILFAILLALVLTIFFGFKPNKYDFQAYHVDSEIAISDIKNEYKILYFGYLFCPDVCPTTLFTVSDVLNKIKRDDIKLLFITLDPERDSVKDMNDFVLNFYKNSMGLKAKDLKSVTDAYGVKFKKIAMPNSAMGYSVAHSSSIYLLDKDGNFFAEVSNLTQEEITDNILNLLKQRP